MYCLSQFCCLCFRDKVKLKLLHKITCDDATFIKMARVVLPEIQLSEISHVTSACLDCVNFVAQMHAFRQSCIRNNFTLVEHIELLSSLGGEIGNARVEMLDFRKVVINADPNIFTGAVKRERDVEEEEVNYKIKINDNFGGKEVLNSDIQLGEFSEDCFASEAMKNCDYIVTCGSGINCNETAISHKEPLKEVEEERNMQSEESSEEDGNSSEDWSENSDSNDEQTSEINSHNTCKVCGKTFKTKNYLQKHTLNHNENRSRHKCNTCGKLYFSLFGLKFHRLTHTGEKPHACKICGETFPRKYNLKQHALGHDENSVNCSTCGKSFSNVHVLKSHEIVHTEKQHGCGMCGKLFRSKHYLRQHVLNHDGRGGEYACDICDRSFCFKSALKVHRAKHARKKRHKCEMCGKCFSSESYKRFHVSTFCKNRRE